MTLQAHYHSPNMKVQAAKLVSMALFQKKKKYPMAPGHKHQPVVQRNRRQIRKNRCTIFLAVEKFSMLLKNKQLSRLGCESDYQRLPLRELKTVYDDSHSNTLGREA